MVKKFILLTTIAVIACSGFMVTFSQTAGAVTASDWIAGNIIDDSIFTKNSSMSVSQIQTFLNNKVGTGYYGRIAGQCDTNGLRVSELGGGTRAQYGAAHNNPKPFTCLKDYYEVPKTSPGPGLPANNYGGKPRPVGSKSAAQLIWDAAQKYNISPKVLLVKLGTESAGPLTTDDWPFLKQYTYAMGAHCPDSGPGGSANCDSDYAGFSIQISEAAALLRWYLDNMTQPWWSYKKPYKTNSILWNVVETGCGASNVYIGNKSTAALYTYTPYQPNRAALLNMYGTGNSCSAYGNRNFWRTFNDWFGTVRDFISMDTPRWMVLSTDTYKKNPSTGENLDFLPEGTQLKFTTKVWANGAWYLRTKYDTYYHIEKAIPISDIAEIQFTPTPSPRYMKTTGTVSKIDPLTSKTIKSETFPSGTQLKIQDEITVNGVKYYRSAHDSTNRSNMSFSATSLREITYQPFENPRYMMIAKDSHKVDPVIGSIDNDTVSAGTWVKFSSKISVAGKLYFRTENDTNSNTALAIDSNNISDIEFTAMGTSPKWLALNKDSEKSNVGTLTAIGVALSSGTQLKITDQTTVNGQTYYRTEYDSTRNNAFGIPSGDFSEIPYVAMNNPRQLQTKINIHKINPKTGQPTGVIVYKGTKVMFTEKIIIKGSTYLRSQYDTSLNLESAIPLRDLAEL